MSKPKTIIVMPAYNVGDVLAKTIAELPADCADEIIVVDDGSTDDTAEVANHLNLTVIRHDSNKGYGGAQKTGFKAAVERGAQAVILVHGDNQYDPSKVHEFSQKILSEGFHFVTGTRMILGDALRGGMPIWKFIPNRFLTWLENVVFQTNLTDYHNGYRAYSGEFLSHLPFDLMSDRFDFDTDIIIQGAMRKLKIAEVPHKTRYNDENSQMSFSKGVIYGTSILKTVLFYLLHRVGIYKQKIYVVSKEDKYETIKQG